MKDDQIRKAVRGTYGRIAKTGSVGCSCGNSAAPEDISVSLGYSDDDVSSVPEGANMGLGCGNPQAIASLQPGETVLDLGSGGGFDCFLAAKAVAMVLDGMGEFLRQFTPGAPGTTSGSVA